MALVKNNIITQGLSGTIGGEITFRQVHNRTVAVRKRQPNRNPPQAGEQAGRDRFKAGVAWYQQVVKPNPVLLAAYAAAIDSSNQTAYNKVIADFMIGPEITAIDAGTYRGQPGNVIKVQATDNFKVAAVQVSLYSADGALIEAGAAVPDTAGLEWHYNIVAANPDWPGGNIQVQAFDLPGNRAEANILL